MTRGIALTLFGAGVALASSGCGDSLDTSYGRSGDRSINGTAVLAALLRDEGHTVRRAIRLTPEIEEWADVIVRFAPYPGPPAKAEGEWYLEWMKQRGGRRMIYVVRDYDDEGGYRAAFLDRLIKAKKTEPVEPGSRPGTEPKSRVRLRPPPAKEAARAEEWFAVEPAAGPAAACKALGGPWAAGIDPRAAALSRHDSLKTEVETVLLSGDGKPLVIEWSTYNNNRVLVAASGTFLLNLAMVNKARRPLAQRVARWPGSPPGRVAFVEGQNVLGTQPAPPSPFTLLSIAPFGLVAAQLAALGLAACLARAPRLGRPRPEPPSGADRPVAHPEALGLLLARSRQEDDARAILESYRRWRSTLHPSRAAAAAPQAEPKASPTSDAELLANE